MKYLFFLKRALKNNTIYRFDYFLGCLNVCIQIFISCEIWKALYITNHVSGKVSLNVVLTSFIINLGLSNIYSIDDLTVQRKFCDGTIICELLKPINYFSDFFLTLILQNCFQYQTVFLFHFFISFL